MKLKKLKKLMKGREVLATIEGSSIWVTISEEDCIRFWWDTEGKIVYHLFHESDKLYVFVQLPKSEE